MTRYHSTSHVVHLFALQPFPTVTVLCRDPYFGYLYVAYLEVGRHAGWREHISQDLCGCDDSKVIRPL